MLGQWLFSQSMLLWELSLKVFQFIYLDYFRSVLSWNVASYKDITEESLSLFYALDPKIDVLVVGIGDQMLTQEFSKQIIGYMRKHKINVEILNTDKVIIRNIKL